MKYCFLSVISDGANTRPGSIFTPYKFYYSWNKANDTDKVSNGISSLLTMIEGAFAKDRVLAILRDFVFYSDDSKKDEAIVCRYPQFFGAHKMLDSVREHMRPEGDGKGGTYFGATGCGKTYTMLFLSRLIAPGITRLSKIPRLLFWRTVKIWTRRLRSCLLPQRSICIRAMFAVLRAVKTWRKRCGTSQAEAFISPQSRNSARRPDLSDRSNIICISDEAHRTQTGVGAKLKKTDKGVFTTSRFCQIPA